MSGPESGYPYSLFIMNEGWRYRYVVKYLLERATAVMAMTINTNVASLTSQNYLMQSWQSMNVSIERLSSGQRINSARDDAAGLAITNRLDVQVKGLNQTERNISDAFSLTQTAGNALGQVTDNLLRIRELTVKAANDTLKQEDRSAIQDEIDQRLKEIDRLATQTTFNGISLLNERKTLSIQIGANDRQTFDLKLMNVDTTSLNLDGFSVGETKTHIAYEVQDLLGFFYNGSEVQLPSTFNINGEQTAGSYKVYRDSQNNPQRAIMVGDTLYHIDIEISIDSTSEKAFVKSLEIGHKLRSAADPASDSPIAAVDAALETVNRARSSLGAQQNRLATIAEGNADRGRYLTSAISRIRDADYAHETAEMTRAQIVQQAGTSVLAQANQTARSVLTLLT